MKYIVTEVLGDFDAQFGKRRVSFKVEGNPNKLSGFFASVPSVGEEMEGEIVQKGDFWNFVLPKKTFQKAGGDYQPAPDQLRVERKIDLLITEVQLMRGMLSEKKSVDNDDPF